MVKPTWYSHSHHPWTFKVPGTGRAWKIAVAAAGVVVVFLVLFAGNKSLISLLALNREHGQLEAELTEIRKTNLKLKQQIDELHAHPQAVEPIAREELGLARPGELIYRFVPESGRVAPARTPLRNDPKQP